MLRLFLLGDLLLLLALTKELSLLASLGRLCLGKVRVVDRLGELDVGNVNLGRGGDNVCLGNTTKGDTVELEGARNEEQTRVELLQKHNSLAAETSSKENEDGTGGDAVAENGLGGALAGFTGRTDVLGGVVLGRLVGGDQTLLAVGLATDLLLGTGGGFDGGGGSAGLFACGVLVGIMVDTWFWHGCPMFRFNVYNAVRRSGFLSSLSSMRHPLSVQCPLSSPNPYRRFLLDTSSSIETLIHPQSSTLRARIPHYHIHPKRQPTTTTIANPILCPPLTLVKTTLSSDLRAGQAADVGRDRGRTSHLDKVRYVILLSIRRGRDRSVERRGCV